MSSYSGTIIVGTDDYDYVYTGNTTILAGYNGGTGVENVATINITTSGLSGDSIVISSATLYWYNHSYTKSKTASY